MNRFFNIAVGAAGLLYVLNDTYFRIMVNLYVHQGFPEKQAEKIANSSDIFIIIIFLAIAIVAFGVLALISNLILFYQRPFFIKVCLNVITMLMPFIYVKNGWFLLYEGIFCGLFATYLISLKKIDAKKSNLTEKVQKIR
ncbi:hypothetical protein [Liquorilactobacillus sicerae]|uniref:hypothetical protein n=1 Tax=Liquorilactobacillus sicerae TaxID=1416943 RepID=UPI00248163FA|nr:hypothetical protein [Liquorilactobacillus sicerae]